jgi:hypothetical protein
MKRLAVIALAVSGCSMFPGTQANLEKRAREAARLSLFDADTARFQHLQEVDGSGGRLLCGLINAKNKMGAYTGFVRFIADRSTGTIVIDPEEESGDSQREFNVLRRQASAAGCRF